MINIEIIKQKIINFLNQKGPSLPFHISREIELSPMFSSAILSELTDTKQIKTSSLKVGSSPLYFLPNQEQQLEKFAENLGGVEKEAFLKLQQKKILEDKQQTPAIRVALRSIRDFAISFKIYDNLFWRYAFLPKEEFNELIKKLDVPQKIPIIRARNINETFLQKKETPKIESIFDKPLQVPDKPTTDKPKPTPHKPRPKKAKKINQNFLEEIKPFLEKKQIQIFGLEEVNKKKVLARVYIHSQLHLLAVFNKKRITELELINVYRKAAELNLPYYILTKGIPTKKMKELSEAYKKLTKIDILE